MVVSLKIGDSPPSSIYKKSKSSLSDLSLTTLIT